MSRIGKSIETESRLGVTQGCREREVVGVVTANGYGLPFGVVRTF